MVSVSTDQRLGVNASQAIKVPCDMSANTNIVLSGEQTIDGQLSSSSRCLLTGQTDPVENGIYDTNINAWTRSPDWDGPNDVVGGTLIYVRNGTINSGDWRITTTGTITPGTTSVSLSNTVPGGGNDLTVVVKKTRTGSITTSQHEINERTANFFDFLTASQISDYLNNVENDMSFEFQKASDETSDDATLYLPNGLLYLGTTSVDFFERVVIVGEGMYDTVIRSNISSGLPILRHRSLLGGGSGEYSGFNNFTIETKSSATDRGFQLDVNKTRLNNIRITSTINTAKYLTAAIRSATIGIDDMAFNNVHVTLAVGGTSPLGLEIVEGNNISIHGGIYEQYGTNVRLGETADPVRNVSLTGGVKLSTVSSNNATAVNLDVIYTEGLSLSGVNMLCGAAGHLPIKVSQWNGGKISGSIFDGGSSTQYAMDIVNNPSPATSGINISGNIFKNFNQPSFFLINKTGAQLPNIDIGLNTIVGTATSIHDTTVPNNDTSPSLGLGNYFVISNAGATTINNFENLSGSGQKIVTVFITGTTTTIGFNSASLFGNNELSYACRNGDVITFTFNGTSWKGVVGRVGVSQTYIINGGGAGPNRTLLAVGTTANNRDVLYALITDLRNSGVIL
jgi:hypothetical protein